MPVIQSKSQRSPKKHLIPFLTIKSAYYRFSHRTLSVEVVAYRDIQPGEEITISCKLTSMF